MNFEEFDDYCRKHAETIAVRDQVNGELGSYYLTELPDERVQFWINQWFSVGFMPFMMP